MLDAFILSHRDAILERTRARVAARGCPEPSLEELSNGIPIFLDQLGEALRLAIASDVVDHVQMARSAGQHGLDLLQRGFTIA